MIWNMFSELSMTFWLIESMYYVLTLLDKYAHFQQACDRSIGLGKHWFNDSILSAIIEHDALKKYSFPEKII